MAPAWAVRYTAPLRYATAAAALLLVAVVTGDMVASSQASEHIRTSLTEAEQDTRFAEAEAPAMEMAAPDEKPAPAPEAAAETRAVDGVAGEDIEPAQAPDEPSTTNTLLRWVEAALGLVVAALIVVAAVQWRTSRRIRAG